MNEWNVYGLLLAKIVLSFFPFFNFYCFSTLQFRIFTTDIVFVLFVMTILFIVFFFRVGFFYLFYLVPVCFCVTALLF